MHDTEKSDFGIVAMKPTNKTGRPVAELAEPRPETKGNVGQQNTHRAQDRARVTQALDRVRNAARLKKKERFTALLHHINVDALRTAFYALRRKAAAGVDGITWQDDEAAPGTARTGSRGSVPTATVSPDVHTEGGWKATGAGDRSPGRNRPRCNGHGAQRDLRR